MKAITVKQPWASLIVEGVKDIENRTWKTHFRGRVLIHAAKTDLDLTTQMTSEYQRECIKGIVRPYVKGAIIGSVEIIDCVKSNQDLRNSPWGNFYCYHWVLANPIKFDKPIPAKGKLSFWEFEL